MPITARTNQYDTASAIRCSGPSNSSFTGTPKPCLGRSIRFRGTMPSTAFFSTYFSVPCFVLSALGMLNARPTKR